ncbi:MAPEG family protein [Dongia deserti]|uniref:MAPEG family protein n=1 Tax=Dongia deserti TaxID=2268030 RepID=UPI000E65DA48|nr:MAPEG family protein [Dongia deserti]
MSALPQSTPSKGAPQKRWPRWARRNLMENIAVALIAIGVLMLVQPFTITLYGWSFTVVLVGTVMFTIVSKFPE